MFTKNLTFNENGGCMWRVVAEGEYIDSYAT
jgi:hypothetical protein